MAEADVVIAGAGVVGLFTARELQRRGAEVLLVDPWEPGHARQASAGIHRVIRATHGSDELYTKWARESRLRFLEMQAGTETPIYNECGAVVLAETGHDAWERATIPTFQRLGIPYLELDPVALTTRFPTFTDRGVSFALYEPEAGFLWARNIVRLQFTRFLADGGRFRRVRLSVGDDERPLLDGSPVEAERTVIANGAWMGFLLRRTLGRILRVVRQDIIYTSVPENDDRWHADRHPVWIDHGYGAYGIPDAGGYGFKAAIAWHEADIDLDADDRVVDRSAMARSQQYLAYRFPDIAEQAIVDQKVCQIVMTPDTHFLLDHHPDHPDVILAGGGSGSIFKHGPVVGEYVAGLVQGDWLPDPRFRVGDRHSLSLDESPSGR